MTEPGPWIRALAPAKVNLTLAVLGRRDDGFHELATTMLALDLMDEVAVRVGSARSPRPPEGAATGARLSVSIAGPAASPDVPADATNLAARAAAAVRARAAREDVPLEISIEKHVPSRAGLGGGSSDAAAAWIATEAALGSRSDSDAIWRTETIAEIGSDCAFFLNAERTGAANCTGRGTNVTSISSPYREWWIAVITPEIECPTRDVFAAWGMSLRRSEAAPSLNPDIITSSATRARAFLFNSLEPAATATVPTLSSWRAALNASGADHFILSGSGSTYFGLYDSRADALDGLQRVEAEIEERGLRHRGTWIARPAGHGAKLG